MIEHYGKEQIYRLLEEKGIPFDRLEHKPVFTMNEMEEQGITRKGRVCKNLFLRDAKGKTHYLISVPEEKSVNLKELAAKIGSTRLSFASKERLAKHLQVGNGSVSPLGVLNDKNGDVIVVFDKGLENESKVGVHPNDNTATIWLSFEDLKQVIEENGNRIIIIDL